MLLIGIGLAIFQQAVGINTVIYYAPTIFTKAGLGTSASVLGTMGIGVLNVIMCITAMILIDRIGRKKLLMWGSVGITLSLASLSAILLLAGLSASTAWLTVLFLGIYIVFYQATWGFRRMGSDAGAVPVKRTRSRNRIYDIDPVGNQPDRFTGIPAYAERYGHRLGIRNILSHLSLILLLRCLHRS